MRTEIVTKNVDNEAVVREFIQRKLGFALDRINARIDSVVVRLADESRNSDTFDGLCQIDAMLNPVGKIHVSAKGVSAYDSVLQAIKKIENAIKHDIDRHRRSSRVRHEKTKRNFISTLATDDAASTATD